VGKVIVKSAIQILSVLLAIAIAGVLVLHFGFPEVLASYNEKIGNYKLATEYCASYYAKVGGIENLSRCVDNAILSDKKEYIVLYGEELIADDGFETLCAQKDAQFAYINLDYKQYVGGKVAVAKYKSLKFVDAMHLALQINGTTTFKQNNALIQVSTLIVDRGDVWWALKMLELLDTISPSDSSDVARLNEIKQILIDLGD